ncbi:MAG TPA: tetratricopeptide repeat protein [Vicinamibacterales bacterium]
MRKQQQSPFNALTAVTGVAGILFGVIVGYIIGAGQAQPVGVAVASAPAAQAAAPAAPATTVVTDTEIQAYRDILTRDPKNVKAATDLANKLYDAGRFAEAIPYYQQAHALDPKNVSISTDLGTALYYAGRPDEALAQLEISLKTDPTHAQTLFNIGIVKRDGKKDGKGAIAVWQRLLEIAPDYPEAARVRSLIAETKS